MDKFSLHEILDRTFLTIDMFHRHVIDHDAFEELPESIKDKIHAAGDLLWEIYQDIGLVSLSDEEPPSTDK